MNLRISAAHLFARLGNTIQYNEDNESEEEFCGTPKFFALAFLIVCEFEVICRAFICKTRKYNIQARQGRSEKGKWRGIFIFLGHLLLLMSRRKPNSSKSKK